MKAFLSVLLVLAVAFSGFACSPTLFEGDVEDYNREIGRLQRQLLQDPEDAEALRDLGAIYLRTRQYAQANTYLERAFGIDADDPKTLFNLALANETLAKRDTALRLYEKYPDVSRSSPYRRLMRGRYAWLSRSILRDQMRELAAQETVETDPTSPRILAVFPWQYQGEDDRYQPLSRGLAEMVSVDLATIANLRVVERVQMQYLLDELALVGTDYLDPNTAPRVGRLLGAGRLVSGTYNVLGNENLRLDGAFLELETSQTNTVSGQTAALSSLFAMQKALVFNLLLELGIELTPEERERLEAIPTRNLQAFLAYSRGLLEEDEGAYGLAAGFYERAAQLDPSFSIAAERAQDAESAADADMEAQAFIAATANADVIEAPGGIDLTSIRLGNMNGNIGAGFLPGDLSRKPATETGSETILLPAPPSPPGNNP